MDKICGIYEFINIITDDIYVGQSVNILKRYNDHIKSQGGSLIDNAIIEYGIDNFEFIIYKVIDTTCLSKKEIKRILDYEETKRINELECCIHVHGKGYNKTLGGGGSSGCNPWNKGISCTGHPCSEETKKKIGDKNRGKKRTPEQRAAQSARPFTPEHCKHISDASKGRKAWNKGRNDYISEDSFNKMMQGAIKGGQVNGDKTRGTKKTEDEIKNISDGTKKRMHKEDNWDKFINAVTSEDYRNNKRQEKLKWWTQEKRDESSKKQTGGFYMTDGIEKPKRIIASKQPEYFTKGWYRCDTKGNKKVI